MNNSRELGGPGWSYSSGDRKERANQGSSQVKHGRLDAGMAVGTSRRTRRRLVVMEQAAEESENQDRNNGKSHDWELSADAPFWMLKVHGVIQRESSISQTASLSSGAAIVYNNLVNGLKGSVDDYATSMSGGADEV